jgi:hypothetical protein
VLSGAVFLVYRLLSLALGQPGAADESTRLAQSAAFALIGAVVWLYHAAVLRSDGRLAASDMGDRLAGLTTAVLDTGDGAFGLRMIEALARQMPQLPVRPIGLTMAAAEAMGGGARPEELAGHLSDAHIVVVPWHATVPDPHSPESEGVASGLAASPGHKLVVPTPAEGWAWPGVEPRDVDDLLAQTVHAIRLLAAGETVEPRRPLGVGAWIGIALAVLLLFAVVITPILNLMIGGGLDHLFGP